MEAVSLTFAPNARRDAEAFIARFEASGSPVPGFARATLRAAAEAPDFGDAWARAAGVPKRVAIERCLPAEIFDVPGVRATWDEVVALAFDRLPEAPQRYQALPRARSLRCLTFWWDCLQGEELRQIEANGLCEPLRRLEVCLSHQGDAIASTLAEVSPRLPSLRELTLRGARLTDAGVAALCAMEGTPLQQLDLGRNAITDRGLSLLSQSRHGASLEALYLDGSDVTAAGLLGVLYLGGFPTLTRLCIACTCREGGAFEAARRTLGDRPLRQLDVSACTLSAQELEALQEKARAKGCDLVADGEWTLSRVDCPCVALGELAMPWAPFGL